MVVNNYPGFISDIERLYGVLIKIEKRNGGKRRLASCNGRMDWPLRGWPQKTLIYLSFIIIIIR